MSVGLGSLVLVLMLAGASPAPGAVAPRRAEGLGRAPAGLVAAMLRHAARGSARDPADRIDARGCARLADERRGACFTPDGARLHTARGSVRLQPVAWGRAERLHPLLFQPGRTRANRVAYRGG